ncbi:MAG TPA: TonB-dependent receptor [Bacteroidetes bacterium]|nr:TonB-dependent receptor [Bacteroidota bacterium]
MRFLIILIFLLSPALVSAQDLLRGTVKGLEDGKETPLSYATVQWLNTTVGVVADGEGKFSIERVPGTTLLVVSFIGFSSDTIETKGKQDIRVVLNEVLELDETVVMGDKKATTISSISSMKVEVLGKGELKKAACCNLSESFETNPTVEVSFSDALTGMRQIQMLGLSGIYAQTLVENMPMVHGLNASTGLSYIPGPFVENIYLSKGAGSVMYGFESMTGQINIDLIKPETAPKFYLNGYVNMFGRTELNAITRAKVSKKWSTSLMAHVNSTQNKMDPNKDGFYNLPSGQGLNLINRWKYQGKKWEGMVGFKYLDEQRTSGQIGYKRGMERDSTTPYGVEYNTRQGGVWAKLGRMESDKKPTSIGFVFHANRYENTFIAGLNTYNGIHDNLFGSMVFNRKFGKPGRHTLSGGAGILADRFDENYNGKNFARTELVPGIFAEYTYALAQKFSAVFGARLDYHNLFGAFVTPRMHLRYAINERHVLRASAGRGQRTANIFAENSGILVSSRKLILEGSGYPGKDGLLPEVSWNYGGNYTYTFPISSRRSAQFSMDYYYVHFVNQTVVDLDNSAREVRIYNLNGKSYSQTFQAQFTIEPIAHLEARIAYRYLDVKTTYTSGLREKSLLSPHRGFINLAYETEKKWAFDLTTQFIGRKRLPDLIENPEGFRMESRSPAYVNVNAQISKKFKKWDIYLGGENLLNVKQNTLIVDAENPYGSYFDASMVWGPTMGAMAYIGFRYELK